MVSFLFANNLINKICSVLQTTDAVKSEHSEAEANRNAEDAPMEMDEEMQMKSEEVEKMGNKQFINYLIRKTL